MAGRSEEPGVGIGARPGGWAEGRDGMLGAGPAGGMERKTRAEGCAPPGTPWRSGIGGGARGRGRAARGGAEGRFGARIVRALGANGRRRRAGWWGGGTAGRVGPAPVEVGPCWTRPAERGADGEGCEEADGGRALRGGS